MSLSAAVLRELMAAGLTGEALLAACERIEASASPEVVTSPARTARQERNSRYYASQKRLKASESDVSDGDDLSPQKKVSPDPSKKTTPSFSEASLPRSERKHAWPDDFCDQVWSIFPKHVEKKAGIEALKVLHRADRLDWQTLTDAIRNLAATCEPQFVPALHRWIKGERWTDQRPIAKPGAGPPQRRTFGQLARESAAEAAGYPDDQRSHHQADDHRGPTLDLVPSGMGADLVDLQSHRAGRWTG